MKWQSPNFITAKCSDPAQLFLPFCFWKAFSVLMNVNWFDDGWVASTEICGPFAPSAGCVLNCTGLHDWRCSSPCVLSTALLLARKAKYLRKQTFLPHAPSVINPVDSYKLQCILPRPQLPARFLQSSRWLETILAPHSCSKQWNSKRWCLLKQGRGSQLTASVYTVPHCTINTHAVAAATKKPLNLLKNLVGGFIGFSKDIKDAFQSVRGVGSPCHILLTTGTHSPCHRPALIPLSHWRGPHWYGTIWSSLVELG